MRFILYDRGGFRQSGLHVCGVVWYVFCMKHIFGIVIVLVVVGGGYYALRPVATPSEMANEGTAVEDPAGSGPAQPVYGVVAEKSSVQFSIYELLRGKPFTVVGKTQVVTGSMELDLENIAASRLGTVRINARTLKTDSENRDRATARFILESEKPENEFIDFVMESIAESGTSSVSIAGNLVIRGMAKPAIFSGTLMEEKDGSVRIVAKTDVKRSDYSLTIPDISFIAEVADAVTLEADIVAREVKKQE